MLVEPLRRLAWRVRRAGLLGRPPVNEPPPGTIERFSVFDGRLHLTATIATGTPVTTITLHLPGGDRLPCRFTAGRSSARIDQRFDLDTDALEIASASLVLDFADGTTLRLDGLGAPLGDPAHAVSARFRHMLANAPAGTLLEVGARARSGNTRRDWVRPGWGYSGFDIAAGPNVDVVGDAHALSRHYPAEHFEAVMAFSVLEHLLMPWKFVVELNRVLKTGGIGLFTTHQSWPVHDAPWDFWRFSDRAWAGLLNHATGFEILDARLGEPAYLIAERCSPTTAFAERPAAYLASFVLFRKTGRTTLDWNVDLPDIIDTAYPSASERP